MTSRREELRDTSGVEAGFRQAEGRAQTGTSSADDDGIIFMVLMIISCVIQTSQLIGCESSQ